MSIKVARVYPSAVVSGLFILPPASLESRFMPGKRFRMFWHVCSSIGRESAPYSLFTLWSKAAKNPYEIFLSLYSSITLVNSNLTFYI